MSKHSSQNMGKEVAAPNRLLFLDDLDVGVTGTIVVMICRMWDVNTVTGRYLSTDFVVSDSKGSTIHCTARNCTARNHIAHNFVRLKEGLVYSIKNFVVKTNKDDYRIMQRDPFMLEFDGATTAKKVTVNDGGFDRYPFELQDLTNLTDVAGYVMNVGRTTQQKTGSRTLDFYLNMPDFTNFFNYVVLRRVM